MNDDIQSGNAEAADRAPSTEAAWVEPEHLAAIPEHHRRVIARWLVQRGSTPVAGLFAQQIQTQNDALRGAAVDLADPLADDSTIDHARDVLANLTAGPLH